MLIETFKVFCDLVETKSFSKAAEKNFISQSAVSQQVRALETKFARKLIDRGRGAAEPTEAGRAFYDRAKLILDRFNRLEEEIMERPNTISGNVRVATIISVGRHELPPYVKRFITEHPRATIEIDYRQADQVYDLILSGAADVGIVAYPVRHPELEVVPFRDDQLVFVCSPAHRRARTRRINLRQLEHERLIGFEWGTPTRKAIDRALRESGVAPRYVMEFADVEVIKRMVEVDAGVAILPDFSVAQELRNKTLRALPFAGKKYFRPIALIYKRTGERSAAARTFIEILAGDSASPG
ncbi:MAG TPA: LysR family transcriptional regulator [Blastocatellia bacterium]|nr:LysR family transcriptional regulator [Blastocatellia bacterium]